jgi:para-aminobenzoate synthetase
MRILLVDNYDSFTYNLAQLIAEIGGVYPQVVKNDALDEAMIETLCYDAVVLSPGPGHPERQKDFGICQSLINRSTVPLLGVCLGHQGIAHSFGSRVSHAPEAMHGRVSEIYHQQNGLFYGIPSPFSAVRYHSLLVRDLPDCLQTEAHTKDGLIMALSHRTRPLWGVQFHPESISSEYGHLLIANFLQRVKPRANSGITLRYNTPTACMKQQKRHLKMSVLELQPHVPEDCFQRLYRDSANSFWLDSSSHGIGQGRYSYMGDASGPLAKVIKYNCAAKLLHIHRLEKVEVQSVSLFNYLQEDTNKMSVDGNPSYVCPFRGGYVGYFGYELKSECGGVSVHQSKYSDGAFLFADRFVAFDLVKGRTWLVCLHEPRSEADAQTWFDETKWRLGSSVHPRRRNKARWKAERFEPRYSKATYVDLIGKAMRKITDGESYEVCLTNHWTSAFSGDPFALYLNLRKANPAPYSAFISFGDLKILSSSPERFLQIGSDGRMESKPIKGTLRRGRSPEEDAALLRQLQTSEKARAENLMIVDLIRNDLNCVCKTGSVKTPKLYGIESFKTVHHMVSTIVGELAPGVSRISAIKSLFPGGSMTGAPKIRTMEIIDQLESGPRGVYSGALGYISLDGAVDLSIVIRTLVIDKGEISLGAGGAIVSLSDADAEYEETLTKAHILIHTAKNNPLVNTGFTINKK